MNDKKKGKFLSLISNTGMESQKVVSYTFSMSSADAKYIDSDGSYVFQIPNTNLKNAVRITLSTLELPLSQFPIEDVCSRVCFSEGIHLSANSHTVVVTERTTTSKNTGTIQLPLNNNNIVAMSILANDPSQGYSLEVTTEQPHCLWVLPSDEAAAIPMDPVKSNLANYWIWGDSIRLVDTVLGDVAFDPANLQFVSSTRFKITGARATSASSSLTGAVGAPTGCLYAPPVAGTLFLANIINMTLPYSGVRQIYKVGIDSCTGSIVFTAETLSLDDSDTLYLSISGDGLADAAGVTGRSAVWKVTHPLNQDDGYHDFAAQQKIDREHKSKVFILGNDALSGPVLQSLPSSSHVLKGNALQQVMVGKLPTGWYDISTRPVGATDTHRFTNAWYQGLQPFLLPAPSSLSEKYTATGQPLVSPYSIQFTDTNGFSHSCQLPMGRYTPSIFADTLSTNMTQLSAATGSAAIKVSVDKHPSDAALCRFVFEAQSDGTTLLPSPCRFGLQFDMSQIKASTLGFEQQSYTGNSVYISPHYVCVPHLLRSDLTEVAPRGVWSAKIIGQQRRLQFACNPLSQAIVLTDVQPNGTDMMTLRTGVLSPADGLVRPWTHGYVPGDLIQLRKAKSGILANTLQASSNSDNGNLWEWQTNPSFANIQTPAGCNVDADVSGISAIVEGVPSHDAILLRVTCTTVVLSRSNAWYVVPQADVYPSLLLDNEYYPKSIDPSMLGLPKKTPSAIGPAAFSTIEHDGFYHTAIVFGTAGDLPLGVSSRAPRAFPLSAWSIYRMDPPEILLIELNDKQMKTSTNLQHLCGADIKSTFARINLSSLFREGGLRSDLINSSGEALGAIKLSLKNPDRSPYQMHNASWSFTLNIVTGS